MSVTRMVAVLLLVGIATGCPRAERERAHPLDAESVSVPSATASSSASLPTAVAPAPSSTSRARPKKLENEVALGPPFAPEPGAEVRFPVGLPPPREVRMPLKIQRLFGSIDDDTEYLVGASSFDEHSIALAMPKTMIRDVEKGTVGPKGVLEDFDEFELDGRPARCSAFHRPDEEGAEVFWRTCFVMRERHLIWAGVRGPQETKRWAPQVDAFLASLKISPSAGTAPADAAKR